MKSSFINVVYFLSSISLSVILFVFLVIFISMLASFNLVQKNVENSLEIRAEKLEGHISDLDLISVQKTLLPIKNNAIPTMTLVLNQSLVDGFVKSYTIGEMNSRSVFFVNRLFVLQNNGLVLGEVKYIIDVFELLKDSLAKNYFVFILLILFSIYVVWLINRKNLIVLTQLDRNLTEMADLKSVTSVDLVKFKSTLFKDYNKVKQYSFAESLYRLLEKVVESIEIKSELKASKEIRQMAAQVSHDIRSPVMALKMAINQMHDLPISLKKIVLSSTQRIDDIANVLLTKKAPISLSGSGVRIESLEVLLREIYLEKKMQYSESDVRILFTLSDKGGKFTSYVDAVEFKRLASNLVNNSIEALSCGPESWVEIVLREDSDCNIVEIADNGKGIPEKYLQQVLKEGVSFDKPEGSGLGLAHAKNLMDQLGGTLTIESTVGVGTKVTLKFRKVKHDTPIM